MTEKLGDEYIKFEMYGIQFYLFAKKAEVRKGDEMKLTYSQLYSSQCGCVLHSFH